jgi:hypothetical protein
LAADIGLNPAFEDFFLGGVGAALEEVSDLLSKVNWQVFSIR